jgi:AcrR family transcriptional regulator
MRSPSSRPPGRPKQSENLSIPDTVLRVASHLFMDYGYDVVSLDLIAEAADITKASIYYYFPTKADVFTAAVESLLKVIYRESRKILEGPGTLRERLLILTKTRLAVAETRFDFERVIGEAQGQLNDEQLLRVRQSMHNLAELLAYAISHAAAAGEVQSANPVFAAHAYMALLNTAYARDTQGNLLFEDRSTAAASVVDFLMAGLSETP